MLLWICVCLPVQLLPIELPGSSSEPPWVPCGKAESIVLPGLDVLPPFSPPKDSEEEPIPTPWRPSGLTQSLVSTFEPDSVVLVRPAYDFDCGLAIR